MTPMDAVFAQYPEAKLRLMLAAAGWQPPKKARKR